MNKLVSKNSVQRFKQGRKLQKFKNPSGPIDNRSSNQKFSDFWKGIFSNWNPWTGVFGNETKKQTSSNNSSTKDYSFMKGGTRQRTPDEIQKLQDPKIQKYLQRQQTQGFTAKPTKPAVTSVTKTTPIDNYYVKGYGEGLQDEIAKLGGVRAVQNKLIKLGLLNDRFGADGKWGKNTQAAYEAYKRIAFNPQTIPTEEPIEKTPDYMDSPINNSQVDLAGVAKQYLYAKQGGQLPSRNPVKRFKRNFRLVAQ